jgi:Tol biopolymer transport system component
MADGLGEISPDGRHLSFVDWRAGNLAVRDLSTGQNRTLTKSSWKEWLARLVREDVVLEFPLYSRWSPDGSQIAYDWWSTAWSDSPSNELRVIGFEDTRPRVLCETDENTFLTTVDWSPDGREILVNLLSEPTKQGRLAAVALANGAIRILKENDDGDPVDTVVGYSPDGRYILYSDPPHAGSLASDVFALSSDGQRETRLVDHPSNDVAAGWSPDGGWVLFLSDRTGTLDLWSLPVEDGRPAGEPRLVKTGNDRVFPAGFDESGRFYYATGRHSVDVFTARMDPQSGRILSPPTRAIRRFEGSNDWPAYSRDGSQLTYVSARASIASMHPRFNILCVHSSATGEERQFRTDFRRLAGPSFSSDGKSVLVAAFGEGDRIGIYQADLTTGEFSPVVETGEGSSLWAHAVSPDGTALFYARCDEAEKACRILKRDLVTGAETEIYRGPEREAPTLAIAPNGKTLAFITRPQEPVNAERVVRVVPSSGGTPREIYRFRHLGLDWITLEFSADGKHVFMPRKASPRDGTWTLLRLPVEGGEPQDLGLTMTDFVKMTAHPDRQEIAFSAKGLDHKKAELWVIENFLPEATGRP